MNVDCKEFVPKLISVTKLDKDDSDLEVAKKSKPAIETKSKPAFLHLAAS